MAQTEAGHTAIPIAPFSMWYSLLHFFSLQVWDNRVWSSTQYHKCREHNVCKQLCTGQKQANAWQKFWTWNKHPSEQEPKFAEARLGPKILEKITVAIFNPKLGGLNMI